MVHRSSSSSSLTTSLCHVAAYGPTSPRRRKIAIVGGGLAGLSVAYHLLHPSQPIESITNLDITIMDKTCVGKGGASSVAGGLLHPFSPSGKLIYQGIQGLQETNGMITSAQIYQPNCILSEYLFRLALSPTHKTQLKDTSRLFPEYATWMNHEELIQRGFIHNETKHSTVLGGLLLTNGCKVIHVRNYLKGVWLACQDTASKQNDSISWSIYQESSVLLYYLTEFDTVIYAAGSGLFTDNLLQDSSSVHLPIQLVRGQSVELLLQEGSNIHPYLCGKYIIPQGTFPPYNRVLVGATYEYTELQLNEESVVDELREATIGMCPYVWKFGKVQKITEGYRVQSQRSKDGRLPIFGKIKVPSVGNDCWIFTGLSSRGLIYHSVFGKILSNEIRKH